MIKKLINGYKKKTVIGTLKITMVLTIITVALFAGMAAPAAAPPAPVIPTIISISPEFKNVGDATFTMTVNGTNFSQGIWAPASKVRFDGIDRVTTYVSTTSLNVTIPGTDLMTAGTHSITVNNSECCGGISNSRTFTVNNLVPTTSSISPNSMNVDDAGFTMTVTGTNFVLGSKVRFDGSDRVTTYVSNTSLTATITDIDLMTVGTHNIAVFNPTPGGGPSNSQPFTEIMTLNVAIKYGANRLVQTQKIDGTWQWSNPDTNPATTGYPGLNNILGVTARGLVRTYLATGNVTYLDAAKKTADLLVSKTPDGFGPDGAGTAGKHKVYGQDITFLMEFADAWTQAGNDGSPYSAKADDYMVLLLNNPNRFCATGCANNASALVQDNFNRRQPNLYGWDIEGWVEAAVRTGHTSFASEVVSNMSLHSGSLSSSATGTYPAGSSYVLGLSGYLESYILSGKTPAEYSAIKTQLLSELDTNGSFKIYAGTDDGIRQTSAYALKALSHTTTDMTGTVNYLVSSQSPGGIWIENDGSEYPEVDSEILTALVSIDNTKPVITLLGSSPVTVEAGSVYTDAGATALDNYDGNITSSIVRFIWVNTTIPGTYAVTYDVTDAHGNAAIQVTRTVKVVPASVYSVSGYVFNNLGAGLAGVLVKNGNISTTTAADGSYSIAGFINGIYNLSYTKTDYGRGYLEVTISGADLTNKNKTLNSLPAVRYINGTVIDSGISHTPLAGVTVSTTGNSTVTDGSGKYSLAVVSGSYTLTASYDIRYYTNSSVTVSTVFDAVVNQDIVLVLKPTGTISGAVTVR